MQKEEQDKATRSQILIQIQHHHREAEELIPTPLITVEETLMSSQLVQDLTIEILKDLTIYQKPENQ